MRHTTEYYQKINNVKIWIGFEPMKHIYQIKKALDDTYKKLDDHTQWMLDGAFIKLIKDLENKNIEDFYDEDDPELMSVILEDDDIDDNPIEIEVIHPGYDSSFDDPGEEPEVEIESGFIDSDFLYNDLRAALGVSSFKNPGLDVLEFDAEDEDDIIYGAVEAYK